MGRSYRDAVEIAVAPLESHRALEGVEGAAVIVGVYAPAVPDPVPCVLLPGFEYRIRSVVNEADRPGERIWVLERRRVGNRVFVVGDEPNDD